MPKRYRSLRLCSGAAVLAIAVSLAACGSSNSSSSSSGGSSSGSNDSGGQKKIGAILIGPKNDKGFSESGYDGIVAAEKANPQLKLTATLENRATAQQIADGIQTLAPIDDLVLGMTSIVGPVVDQYASKFPQTRFLQVDGYPDHFHPNVTGFANDWGAPIWVTGVIAAHLTKSKVVGYVGGAETSTDTQSAAAFKEAVHSVDPNIKVLENLTGDYDDVSLAKAATAGMIADGADVILPYLDSGVVGAYNAGTASGKNPAMFRITSADCGAYPNSIGTAVVNYTVATKELLGRYVQGTLKPGAIFVDLQDPAVQTVALCPKYQSNKAIAKLNKDTIAAINSGKIKLPAKVLWPRPKYRYQEGLDGPVHNG